MADCSIQELSLNGGGGLYFSNGCRGAFNVTASGTFNCNAGSFVKLHDYDEDLNMGSKDYDERVQEDSDASDGLVDVDFNGEICIESSEDDDVSNAVTFSEDCETIESSQGYNAGERFEIDEESLLPHHSMGSLIPGLPDDVAKTCMALVPRSDFPAMGCVSKSWKSLIESKEFHKLRKDSHMLEEWLYALTVSDDNQAMRWCVLGPKKNEWKTLPLMPGPAKSGSGFAVIDGKLLVIGGAVGNGAVADVLLYDSALNRWKKAASMHTPRYEFACAVLGGFVYVVGGHGMGGKNLTNVEVYDPSKNVWTDLPSLKRARWGCIGCGLAGKLYIMAGRSSFTIGHSRCVDVFDPTTGRWQEEKNGCMMVLTHAIVDEELFCIEWKHDRKLAVYNASNNSWKRVALPLAGSLNIGFCLANLGGKVLLYPTNGEVPCDTFVFDPHASTGTEWQTTDIRPVGTCLCCATIAA